MSHGKLAEGMLDSCKLMFGDELSQVYAITLNALDDPEEFKKLIFGCATLLDDGQGVLAFCDLFGGTPSNQSMRIENDRLRVLQN